MKTTELDNLSRSDLFEVLKDKCKSNAKHFIYAGLVFLFYVLIYFLLISDWQRPDDTNYKTNFILGIAIGSLTVWAVLYNYLMLKRIENLDTPDQLLRRFKKTRRYNILFLVVDIIVLFACNIVITFNDYRDLARLNGTMLFLFILIFGYYYRVWYDKEKEIIKQLQELVEKK